MSSLESSLILSLVWIRRVSTLLWPFMFAWFGVWLYEKVRKTKLARRKRTIVIIGAILLVIGFVGNAVEQSGKAQPSKKLSPSDLRLVSEQGVSLPDGWKYYEFAVMGFGVAFPGQPRTATVTAGDGTPIRVIGIEYDGNGLTAATFKDQAFVESKRLDIYRGIVEGARKQMNGRVVKEEDLEFAGFPAHAFVIENDTQRSRGVVFAVPDAQSDSVQIINLLSLTRKEDANPYERFVGSWKTLAR